jgi:hypothetical protein
MHRKVRRVIAVQQAKFYPTNLQSRPDKRVKKIG